MTTVSAVELRKNLDRYIKLAESGNDVRVTYRNKRSVVLSADKNTRSNAEDVIAAARTIHKSIPEATRKKLSKLTDADIEQARADHIREKYGL